MDDVLPLDFDVAQQRVHAVLFVPALTRLGAPSNVDFHTLFVSGSVVFVMV